MAKMISLREFVDAHSQHEASRLMDGFPVSTINRKYNSDNDKKEFFVWVDDQGKPFRMTEQKVLWDKHTSI